MTDPGSITPGTPSSGYPQDDGPPPRVGRNALIAVVLAALLGGALWYYLSSRPPLAPTPPPPTAAVVDAGVVAEPLPPLEERDQRTRDALAGLSALREWSEWLAQQDLLGKFTAAVANIAEGESPRAALSFLAPRGTFEVVEKRKKLYASPQTYARYDGVANVVASLDVDGAAAAYKKLRPLIDGVYAEISRPGQRFDDTLKAALERMVNLHLPDSSPELVVQGALYAYDDPKLEALSQAEKHLLRLGPGNAKKVQDKCRELRAALFEGPAGADAPDAGR